MEQQKGPLQGTAQGEAGTSGYSSGKGRDKTQENQTSSTHMGWIQHWKRESSSFKCIHDQTLLMVITVSHIERSLQPQEG